MKCPFCNAELNRVIDSRPSDDNNSIRRRRLCEACGKRFTTYEKLETFPLMVVKKDLSREPFNREKIEKGVLMACHKRPVSIEQIRDLVNDVENEIFAMDVKEVTSEQIGELVMERLKNLEEVAYVRFASVYREFKDVHTFAEELIKLMQKGKEE
ncbi:MAG: transcriptional regulator NrdR [Lachnospiraceae bacterium]